MEAAGRPDQAGCRGPRSSSSSARAPSRRCRRSTGSSQRMAGLPGAARRLGDPAARGRGRHADRGRRCSRSPAGSPPRASSRPSGSPSSPSRARPRPSTRTRRPWSMQVGMALLAVACVALGLGAVAVVPGVLGAGLAGLAGAAPPTAVAFTLALPLSACPGAFGADVAAAAGARAAARRWPLVLVVALRAGRAIGRLRVGDTWGCGRIGQTPRMEYTATAFAEPLRRVFAELYRPTEDLSHRLPPGVEVLRAVDRVPERDPPVVRAGALRSGDRAVPARGRVGAPRCRSGSVHLYLPYLVALRAPGAPAAGAWSRWSSDDRVRARSRAGGAGARCSRPGWSGSSAG